LAEAAQNWAHPQWNWYNGRHRANNSVPWRKIVNGTKNGVSKYYQGMTDAEQQALELRCVAQGNLIEEKGSVRSYYIDAGEIIGASEGEQTKFVYVEHHRLGTVHGSPITKHELERLGIVL